MTHTQTGGGGLRCGLTSLMNLRKGVHFFLCSAFYSQGQCDDVQAPCTQDWKPEVQNNLPVHNIS